jgi:hypothetical protein
MNKITRKNLTTFKAYIKKYGWDSLEYHTTYKRLLVGRWFNVRRVQYHKGTLDPAMQIALEKIPGMDWTPRKKSRTRHNHDLCLAKLQKHVKEFGYCRFSQSSDNSDLQKWLAYCRRQYRQGTIDLKLKQSLEAIPGFSWIKIYDRQ